MEKLKKVATAALKAKGFFSLDQITRETKLDRCEACDVLGRLCVDGLIRRASKKQRVEYREGRGWGKRRYDIVYIVSKRDALAARIAPKLRSETSLDRMWKVIRYLRTFTRKDLVQLAEASLETAKWFTKLLHRQGVLAASADFGPGVQWRLVKDPGPKRPYVTAKKCRGSRVECRGEK